MQNETQYDALLRAVRTTLAAELLREPVTPWQKLRAARARRRQARAVRRALKSGLAVNTRHEIGEWTVELREDGGADVLDLAQTEAQHRAVTCGIANELLAAHGLHLRPLNGWCDDRAQLVDGGTGRVLARALVFGAEQVVLTHPYRVLAWRACYMDAGELRLDLAEVRRLKEGEGR